MNHKPRVSIGLPVYNGEQFLEEVLDSLLAQTYSDFELIISDNASTDRTESICHFFVKKDKRIHYYRNDENIGLGPNFNRTFRLSAGEYLKWATSDDICKPAFLAQSVRVLDNDPSVVLVYPKATFIDETGKAFDIHDPGWDLQSEAGDERLRYVICSGHWVNSILGVIRTKALSRTRLLPGYPGGDYALLGELSLMGKFVEIPESLYLRRLHPRSSSQNTKNQEWMFEYHKGKNGHICLPCWNLYLDHFITIKRASLGILQKFSLVISLLKRMNWGRAELLEELKNGMKLTLNR